MEDDKLEFLDTADDDDDEDVVDFNLSITRFTNNL